MSKKIVVTIGDPAGCGPIITLKAIEEFGRKAKFFVVGDKVILDKISLIKKLARRLVIVDVNTPEVKRVAKGFPSRLSGSAALNYLKRALEIVDREKAKALVTAPLSKEAVRYSCRHFRGHTEFLAAYFGVKRFAMMMVHDSFRVVLLTRHVLTRQVSAMITKELVFHTADLVGDFLRKSFKIKKPAIVMASFNPHAGVDTFLAKEEETIAAGIKESRYKISGPYPADTVFLPDRIFSYDCAIACFHDQAMIPFKLLSIKKGVNLTVGLPIIRTSPSHGVAFDLIRKGKTPFHSSMREAIGLAYNLSYEV
ncbi:MAG: 4-hydroxythreonine-4-phosphate dehydrogenase PdxA [Candidatus Omnitrophota bacterium]